MTYTIALLRGDGIGPEIVDAACRVLETIGERYDHTFVFKPYLMGGCAIDATGVPLPQETVDGCLAADSVLLGAVGGPKWDSLPGHQRPEKGLLGIRSAMGLYTNIRPARLYPSLAAESPLRADIAAKGIDLVMFRELIGGIYFGKRGRSEDGLTAYDTEEYSVYEIERIAHAAFKAARLRRKKVTSIDKANVLESSRLWRATVAKVAEEYPDVTLENMLVDNAAMQMVKNPSQFDVIVTSNIFGDILSDEASQVTGSIGLLPSASVGDSTRGLYEPIHGSAPDIAGTGKANPIATILSAAMMLRYAFSLETEAKAIEQAVDAVLAEGYRTADILGASTAMPLTCTEMTDRILERIG
ncbi:MAG: 3-isopropylmalate dehydrogenase [Ruminococcaceae bacterium]|nr:3-isopropylmalate dehydrogenase [Oscillospiraceae bacterium]